MYFTFIKFVDKREAINITGIEKARKRAGMKQTELAEQMGTVQSTISMWENGTSLPTADKLPKLARVLGCTIDELFDDTDESA